MKLRKNFLPRRFLDFLSFTLIAVFLPIVFCFELVVVLPELHRPGSILYIFTLLLAIFLIFNITGNWLTCMMIDTRVEHKKFEERTPSSTIAAEANGWWHCDSCQQLSPPRSWHCEICRGCILKRDHHCIFTACCIGHRNHRYFMCFVFYMLLGSVYAFVYNSIYLWILHAAIFRNWFSLLKMACPMLMLVTGSSWQNWFLVFYNLNILAVVYSTLLFGYQAPMIWRGAVCYDRMKNIDCYNIDWRTNLRNVFGARMHLVWISPFLSSEQNHDGVNWSKKAIVEDLSKEKIIKKEK